MKSGSNLIQSKVIALEYARFILDDGQALDTPPITIEVLSKINAGSIEKHSNTIPSPFHVARKASTVSFGAHSNTIQ